MAKNKTHVIFMLDMTGSMEKVSGQTCDAVNEYFAGLRDSKGMRCSLYTFNSSGINAVVEDVKPKDVPELTSGRNYVPNHMTPLHDAVGRAIKMADEKDGAKLVTIYTDGLENCSKEYDLDTVRKMVRDRNETVTFTFLGADIDAYAEAQRYGFDPRNTISTSGQNVGATMAANAAATQRWHGAGGQSIGGFYSEDEKHQAGDKKGQN